MSNRKWIFLFILTQLVALFILFLLDHESKYIFAVMNIAITLNMIGIVWMVYRVLKSNS